MTLHLIKLCVGCETVEDLARRRPEAGPPWRLRTRQTPKRADELLDGGSLYWVFKGAVLCRQRLLGVETTRDGGIEGCNLLLDPRLVRVAPSPRRPFQGWRYLSEADAPPDLDSGSGEGLPDALARQLRDIGAW